jgi:hypothetical protein
MPWWRRALREPLLHFFVLGAGLFVLYAFAGGTDPASRRIAVDRGTLENLSATFQRTWQRPPTRAELEGLVADHVREEILAREAEALGLDDGDVIVRRRLRQKMELLAASFGEAAEPSEADLESWLREHAERHRVEPRLSFRHVFLSRERRGEAADADALRLLGELRAGADPAALGDPLLLPSELRDAPLSDVARQFGDGFAARVDALAPGAWSGPVESSYGAHLVRVDARSEGRLPALGEVRDAVLRDWRSAQAEAAREAHYRALREGYTVVIEGLDGPPNPATASEPAR